MSLLNGSYRYNGLKALSLWRRVTLETVLDDSPDLTTRQLVIFTTVYLIDGAHTVKSLAAELNVTKAVITRALDTLEDYGFLRRCPNPKDKRSVIIQRTSGGSRYLRKFGDMICAEIKMDIPYANAA